MTKKVKIVGAGLAGCEAAIYLAERGVKVVLCDIKPNRFTPAHKNADFGELVCSNSLKSNDVYGNASGLMKQEMRLLGSAVIAAADKTKVPAGNALAVDREKFASVLTERIKSNPNVEFISGEVDKIDDGLTVIATGPLTTDRLSESIKSVVGDGLHFYDASAPIVSADSIDMDHVFFGDRYGKGNSDHLNLPLTKEEYKLFISELLSAKRAELKSFEKSEIFEGCMPVEVMAARGKDTLRFGPLKPVGLTDPKTGRWPYACMQLRKENESGTAYNLVGFQTNLLFPEQKRVFGIIPALKNAEYLRYGVMHRNTFINATRNLNYDFSVKGKPDLYFAGQITGVEGYVESAVSGLIAAMFIYNKLCGKALPPFPETTATGSLIKYITTPNKDFQPMNANFGILPVLDRVIKDKALKKRALAERSLNDVENYLKEYLQ